MASGEVSFRSTPAAPAIMAGRTRQSGFDVKTSVLVFGHSEASNCTRSMPSTRESSRSIKTTSADMAVQSPSSSGSPSETATTSRSSSSPRSRANPNRKSRSAATTMTEILEVVIEEPSRGRGSFERQGWVAVEHVVGPGSSAIEPRSDDMVVARRCLWSRWLYRVPRVAEDTAGCGTLSHLRSGLSLGQEAVTHGPVQSRRHPAGAIGLIREGSTTAYRSLYLPEGDVLCLIGSPDVKASLP